MSNSTDIFFSDLDKPKPVDKNPESVFFGEVETKAPEPTTGEKYPLTSGKPGLAYEYFNAPLAPLENQRGGIFYKLANTESGKRGEFVSDTLQDWISGGLKLPESIAKLSRPELFGVQWAANKLGLDLPGFTEPSELIERSEEGMTPEQIEDKRQNMAFGELASQFLMDGLLKFIPKLSRGKVPTAKPFNSIQRRLQSIDNVIKYSTNEGEVAAAKLAKERLLGKYDVESGIAKIAKATGESKENIFKRVWNKTKQWSQETFGKSPDLAELRPEEADKFLEFMQEEEKNLPAVVEEAPKTTYENVFFPQFEVQAPEQAISEQMPIAKEAEKPKAPAKPQEPAKPTPPPTKPPEPPAPPPPSEPPSPSQENPASPEKITPETSKYFSNVAAKVNVEYPFQKIGANETGFAVKSYFDRINKNIDQAEDTVKKIKKLKLSTDQLSNVVLQAESKTPPSDPKEKAAYDLITKYFDESLAELKKAGVLKQGFQERIASDIVNQIEQLQEEAKNASGSKKVKLLTEIKDLKEMQKEVENMRFVSIPVRNLFEIAQRSDPARFKKAVRFLNKRIRKTLSIQDLIDSGLVDKSKLSPEMIIRPYARRLGRDLALAKILNSAKQDGLATLDERPGYVKVPGYVAPELAKYNLHPVFADFIHAYTEPLKFGPWEKLSNLLKGWSFYSPIILPMNDIMQQVWAVLLSPKNIAKLGPAWKQAISDIKNHSANYWEAYENGLFSTPFVQLEKGVGSFFDEMAKKDSGFASWLFKSIAKLPVSLHNKIYDALSTIAWTGDRAIRMATYNYLKSKGLSPREAAQTAALYHGDYARVPIKTRRMLNKFLMTPTFKLVMGATLKENIKASGRVVKALFKEEKIDPDTKAKASGLASLGITLGAIHLIMKSMDWDTEIPFYRYKKNFVNNEGEEKTKHVSFNFPFLLWYKFAARAYKSVAEPGIENRVMNFLKSMKFETGVPIQIASEILENKDRRYKNIYEPTESSAISAIKIAAYIAKRAIPLIGIPAGESFVDPEQEKQVKEEFSRFTDLLTFMFPYVTDNDELRYIRKAQYMMRKLKTKIKKEELSEREINNWYKEIDALYEKASKDSKLTKNVKKKTNR